MILETLDRLSDGVFRWAGKCRFFAHVSESCGADQSRDRGFFGDRRFYRSVLCWQEAGALFRAKRWIYERLLAARSSDLGVLLLSCGGIGLVGNWLFRGESPFSWRVLLPLVWILLSPILMNSSGSVARSIRKSVILRWFLFDFCGISPALFISKKQARPQRWAFVGIGVLIGLLSICLSPVWITLACVGALLLMLLSAVPELAYCGVCFLLPLLGAYTSPNIHPDRSLGSLPFALPWQDLQRQAARGVAAH